MSGKLTVSNFGENETKILMRRIYLSHLLAIKMSPKQSEIHKHTNNTKVCNCLRPLPPPKKKITHFFIWNESNSWNSIKFKPIKLFIHSLCKLFWANLVEFLNSLQRISIDCFQCNFAHWYSLVEFLQRWKVCLFRRFLFRQV